MRSLSRVRGGDELERALGVSQASRHPGGVPRGSPVSDLDDSAGRGHLRRGARFRVLHRGELLELLLLRVLAGAHALLRRDHFRSRHPALGREDDGVLRFPGDQDTRLRLEREARAALGPGGDGRYADDVRAPGSRPMQRVLRWPVPGAADEFHGGASHHGVPRPEGAAQGHRVASDSIDDHQPDDGSDKRRGWVQRWKVPLLRNQQR
mmetsp:Transcript_8976/g.25609  ORF Transcript_8976/g.25609 Transcript_8976/m.25609 type:complete len:208 (-) Transcript_8976:2759-3382(-)